MQVTQEQVTPCEVELRIELEPEKVETAYDDTYRELGKAVAVPGFRKGKAPRNILERFLDDEKVKDRVVDKLVQPAYVSALEETKLDPYAPADVEMVTFEPGAPFVFKAKVPLPPKIELGDYVGLTIEREVTDVTDDHVEGQIQEILEERAEFPEVTGRPAAEGDTVVIEIANEDKPEEEPRRNVAVVGQNLEDFDKGITGMSPDEEKVIQVTYPEEFGVEELRGKTVPLRTRLVELREKKLPELTDEWVAGQFVHEHEHKEDSDCCADAVDTVDKLRARIRGAMEKAAQDVADRSVESKLVKQIVEKSEVCFPDVMVKERVHERLRDLLDELKKREVTLDDYLKHSEKTIEQLYADFEEEVARGLTSALVLREIMRKENIGVDDDEVAAEVRRMAEERGVPVETMQAYVDKTDGMDGVRNRLAHKKVMDFLVHASNIKSAGP